MPLQVEDVRAILNNNGYLRFRINNQRQAGHPNEGDYRMFVETLYYMAVCQVNRLTNTITLTATNEDDTTANAVNVVYQDQSATIGTIMAPGYVYTDSMSGCSFYLYRGLVGDVHGVHASRASGRLVDPSDYFTQRGCSLLYKWDSRGLLAGDLFGSFGAVLCCVDDYAVNAFAVALGRDGQVMRLFEHKVIPGWNRAKLSMGGHRG
jgi:hypothetical protein